MNIILFSDSYPPEINGVATSTYNLCSTLKAHGEKVLVVTTNPFDNKLRYEDGVVRIPGLKLKKYYNYRLSGPYNAEAARIIRNFHPNVIHCQTDGGIGIFGSAMANQLHIGKVYTFHTMIEDYAYYVTRGHFDRIARHFIRFFYKEKSSNFETIISPSEKTYDYLRMVGIDAHVAIIPTGIDFERFSISKENKEETKALKEKFGIKPDEYCILSLGRVAQEKSIDVLLRGYAKFLESKPSKPTKFIITGWGPAEEELKTLAKDLGIEDHVVFTGKVSPDETQKFYHLGDCFVSASITETQGLTFMEAMAASLPVLARYDDNLVGTIQDGQTGYFFFDENDFPKRLEFVMNLKQETRQKIISSALEAIDTYSLERFYQRIMEVYRRVVRQNW